MVRRPSVGARRPSASTISNMNISATSGSITMKFYQKHHWDGGKAALGFWPDWIKTVVSMATDSSHRVIMEKTSVATFSQLFFIRSFLYLQIMMTCMGACRSSKFSQIRPPTAEFSIIMPNSNQMLQGSIILFPVAIKRCKALL